MKAKVCVAMPVYNGSNFLASAVDSVLAQDYERIEAIIVNDGSNDGGATAEIGIRYSELYPDRVRYIEQENKGVGGALNTAIQNMDGDFFAWLSHDDLFERTKTSEQVRFFDEIGLPNAMIFSDFYVIDNDGKTIGETRFDKRSFMQAPRLPIYRGCLNGCTILIPTHLLGTDEPFPEAKRYTQDYWFFYEMMKENDFFFLQRPLVRYRRHPSQDTHKPAATAEAEELWRYMIDNAGVVERGQLYGSSWRFYDETYKILEPTTYHNVVKELSRQRDKCLGQTLVSVIIPFYNEANLVRRALASVLSQSHGILEVLLIDDGSTEDLSDLIKFAQEDKRVKFFSQPNAGPGKARNFGLSKAKGEYVAFLDGDDVFLPEKIELQFKEMAMTGHRFSHTSFAVSYPEKRSDFGTASVGTLTGTVYPAVLGECPILTSTVMLHRSLIAEGFGFEADTRLCEDVMAWIWVACRMPILGIDKLLTVFEASKSTAAINLYKSRDGLAYLIEKFSSDPLHGRFSDQLEKLRAGHSYCQSKLDDGENLNNGLIDYWFSRPNLAYLPAVAEAQSGQVRMAKDSLYRFLADSSGHPVVLYWYASCLAWIGEFAEADKIFATGLPISTHGEKLTNTRIINFESVEHVNEALNDKNSLLPIEFYGSSVGEADDCDVVHLIACDLNYYYKFVSAAFRSMRENSGLKTRFHVHICNPDDEVEAHLQELNDALGGKLGWSFSEEPYLFDEKSCRLTYLTCLRFLVAPAVMSRYGKPILITDADQIVVQPLVNIFEISCRSDIGVIVSQELSFNIFSVVPANVLIASPTHGAFRFMSAVHAYLSERIRSKDSLLWHLDQAALAVHVLNPPEGVSISRLRSTILQSTLAVGEDHGALSPETLFWTINYSIPENSRKLEWEPFQAFQ